MSEEKNLEQAKYDSMKDLEGTELSMKKGAAIKDLEKSIQAINGFDVKKGQERVKLNKALDKVRENIMIVGVIDRLLKEKDY